jgi:glycosyltransferase involved in cell wall biosynthesis
LFFHTQTIAVLALDWLWKYPSVISLDATPAQYDVLGAYYGHTRQKQAVEQIKTSLYARCFRLARKLVTWSQWTKDGLVRDYGVPEDKITVIPPGVIPADWACPSPRSISKDDAIKILFVGGDFERKGGASLLSSFRDLQGSYASENNNKIELHLVTKASLPSERGVFVYNDLDPNSDRLKKLYHTCDIFCLPTFGDCLPMVLSEAGAAGLPVISTKLAAIPEIISDGETGLIIPVGDQTGLTRTLKTLIDNPELRLHFGRQAIQTTGAKFDAVRNAERLLNVIKETARPEHKSERLQPEDTKQHKPEYP